MYCGFRASRPASQRGSDSLSELEGRSLRRDLQLERSLRAECDSRTRQRRFCGADERNAVRLQSDQRFLVSLLAASLGIFATAARDGGERCELAAVPRGSCLLEVRNAASSLDFERASHGEAAIPSQCGGVQNDARTEFAGRERAGEMGAREDRFPVVSEL